MLVQRKLAQLGITLTDDQLATVESKLRKIEGNELTVQIEDCQLTGSRGSQNRGLDEALDISLTDLDLDDFLDGLIETLGETVPKTIDAIAVLMLEELKRLKHSRLKHRKKRRKSFENNLARIWGKGLDFLEMLLAIALEAGDDFNEEFRAVASREQDYVFEVLTRLHSRSCQIGSEIIVLLRSGHADGAHARWRSLHEIAVTGFFIQAQGNEVAERYLLHDAVESYKAAKLYQEHYALLGYESLSEKELQDIKSRHDQLMDRFGDTYGGEYGWASVATGNKNPSFRTIERAVGLDHLRPHYKLASHNVHANPKGAFFKLGLFPSAGDILLAGPSNAGLADPGHATAISLVQITTALLTTRPNIDRLVICQVLMRLEEETGNEFLAAHKSLKDLPSSLSED